MGKTTIRVVDDKEFVEQMREKIRANNGYCPCVIDKTPDTKCMCKEFRMMKSGTCHCGLYIKEIQEDLHGNQG